MKIRLVMVKHFLGKKKIKLHDTKWVGLQLTRSALKNPIDSFSKKKKKMVSCPTLRNHHSFKNPFFGIFCMLLLISMDFSGCVNWIPFFFFFFETVNWILECASSQL